MFLYVILQISFIVQPSRTQVATMVTVHTAAFSNQTVENVRLMILCALGEG